MENIGRFEGLRVVCFLVTSVEDLTPHTDAYWMTLLIDPDQSKDAGWEGYDLAVNGSTAPSSESRAENWVEGKRSLFLEGDVGPDRRFNFRY